mgnify:CR=1 FL=1
MSIFEEIRDSADGRELSERWYRYKVKQVLGTRGSFRGVMGEADARSRGSIPKWGNMNLFWYRPKTAKKLPYYDMFPMIMLIGADKDTFLGINFHYLRPKWRAILLDRVTAKIGGGLPKWSKLRNIRQIAPTIKRYRFDHIMRKVIPIEEDEQEIAIFLPTERFKKSGKAKVWSESERKFG